jgi:hypothetical protein
MTIKKNTLCQPVDKMKGNLASEQDTAREAHAKGNESHKTKSAVIGYVRLIHHVHKLPMWRQPGYYLRYLLKIVNLCMLMSHMTIHFLSFSFSFSLSPEPVDISVQPALLAASAAFFFFFLGLADQPRFLASLMFLAALRSARLGRRLTVGDVLVTGTGGACSHAGTCWLGSGTVVGGLPP